ncbi:MAG: deoxyribodipyrimidine photolyase [Legionellales bacterium]|nr:deoxyribodipyrimidine photolyase [Legionellales bacterium]OUX66977.1 MAG: deoxyribodipyrimidine photolyase [bacterium TMED178]
MHIVWFKRDLRVVDHQALHTASQYGPVMPLYIIEPALWSQPDLSYRQYAFLKDCLHDLNQALSLLGQPLIIRVGQAADVLADLIKTHGVRAVWSHQETWNHWTYQRDIIVKKKLNQLHIPWHEPCQNGVIRCLKDRNGWARRWYSTMKQTPFVSPSLQPIKIPSDPLPTPESLGLIDDDCPFRLRGGRQVGLKTLHAFLYERGMHYTKAMSSPVTAFESCSRLSPYFAFGCLSIREAFQQAEQRQQTLNQYPSEQKKLWSSALRSFTGRLRWHCHFIQKLEDQPDIELHNLHKMYDQLRQPPQNTKYLSAWQNAATGFPMIDACMRALKATGWLNFRMRAMLMSFASYHLWLHWREPALFLARLFVDYEPGIHYSQVQMQSGTTGINSIRIYNPIKQSQDQDPEGIFIRQWLPELKDVPNEGIHTPWIYPESMNGYPHPIIDEKKARTTAASQLYGLRKNKAHRSQSQHIVKKHASRRPQRKKPPHASSQQNELPL